MLAEHGELEQLRQRVIAAHHLDPMEQGEIEPYIKHRLSCVGWDGNPEFDEGVFAGIYQASGGIPRRVNQVATRLLLLGAVEQRTRIDQAMLDAVLTEMRRDNGLRDAAAEPGAKIEPIPAHGPVKHAVHPAAERQPAPQPEQSPELSDMLAERDTQIAELQHAILELSDRLDAVGGEMPAGTDERIAALEARLEEQERTVRHVLTMLIEWFESGQGPRAAA